MAALSPVAKTAGTEPKRSVFNVHQLAEFLGVSRATVWRLNKSGNLPKAIRLGRSVRWDRWTIEEWVSAGAPPRAEWETMKAGK